jgi:hypothetical protein
MATEVMGGHSHTMDHSKNHSMSAMKADHYSRFGIMIALSFIAMYILMYSMVNVFSNAYSNVNQFYMAGLMVAPMAIIEIVLMSRMYPNKKLNAGILIASVLALLFFWTGIRTQLGVGDKEFVRSMIPHHASAILMCNEANISDAQIKALCVEIRGSQQKEVDQMKGILARLNGR